MVECQICFETKNSSKVCPLKNCDKCICKDCKSKLNRNCCPFCQRKLPQPWYNIFNFCTINTKFENILHLNSYIILLLPTILITLLSLIQIINCLLEDVK